MRAIRKIILHCSDSSFGTVDIIRDWHTKPPFNFADIGYHYVIQNGFRSGGNGVYLPENDGYIDYARPLSRAGAHCKGDNNDSIGICLIGKSKFSCEQWKSLLMLIYKLREKFGKIPIGGHYEMKSGIEQGKTCPNIDMEQFRRDFIDVEI